MSKLHYFDFCKEYLHRNFVHCNSNKKNSNKNNRNLENSKDFKKYFIILKMYWFGFDPTIQRGKHM